LKLLCEFLDLYGFELWKPIVMKRIVQLVPKSSENLIQWMEFMRWKSRFQNGHA
jgi:hypothetical protein